MCVASEGKRTDNLAQDGELIDRAHLLNNIPGVIVQGRYDVVCPAKTAWELHKKWTKSKLIFVDGPCACLGPVSEPPLRCQTLATPPRRMASSVSWSRAPMRSSICRLKKFLFSREKPPLL